MIHAFKCEKCNKIYEEYIRISEPIVSKCPLCKKSAKKIFGFYGIKIGETWPQYNVQADRTFDSRHQEDSYFEDIGAVRV